jgi:tetratricopeptide (TPR) repeat protein
MSTTPRPGEIETPEQILGGRYRLVAPVGAGGMGVVHAAHDLQLRRRVAVKLLPPEIQSDTVARERLRAEALAAAALDHPFICKIHEIGESGDRLFIVMEYVDGETLHSRAAREALSTRQVVEIAIEIAEALEQAHGRGVIHRDLKPSNIMLTAQGHAKVMDFGLAKQLGPEAPGSGAAAGLTEPGMRIGTTAYMSPEQVLGGPLDSRSDIFSLGVILHELATGRHPFARGEPSDTIAAILCDPPARGDGDFEGAPGLGALVGKMLAKACAQRPQSMRDLRLELEGLLAGASAGAAGTSAEPPGERTPFVGRDAERAELARLLDVMLTGHGGCVLIGGEPGVGKTRLARELMKVARQRGCLCLTGHCYEMEGAPPFVPFVEIVEESVRLVPAGVRAALGDLAPEIASIVPSLRRAYADIPPLPDLPAEVRRRLVFGAFVEYVRRGMQKSPSVLLLDDLHWADEPTLQLLAYLAPQLQSMRLLVVGTYRDVELDVKRPFAKALESLLRQRLATRMPVRRLDEPAVVRMLGVLGGSAPPSELARAVFRETEGNPFFVEEVYQHLKEEGKLFDAPGRWKSELRAGAIDVPEGVRLVVGRRLERLGEQARKILTAGAVIGRTFPLDLLTAVVDAPEDAVLDGLEEAERAQLIAIEPARRVVRYGFVHELIRTTLTGGLSMPRRQRLHLRIADALERSNASSQERVSALAHHLYQAGAACDVQRAAGALTGAIHAAVAAAAFEEALALSDNLLALELPDIDEHVADVYEQRGDAFAGLERHDEAVAAWERALDAYGARGDDSGVSRSTRSAQRYLLWLGREEGGAAVVRRGLEALPETAVRERTELEIALAVAISAAGLVEEAAPDIARALAAAERAADKGLLAYALQGAGINQRFSCEYSAGIETGRRALALSPDDDLWARANVLVHVAMCHWHLGQFAAAEALVPEIYDLARRARHHGARWNCELLENGLALGRSGDLRAHLARLEPHMAVPRFAYMLGGEVALTRFYLGEDDRGLGELAEAVSLQPAKWMWAGVLDGCLFYATALAGRDAEARELAPRVEPFLPKPGRRNPPGTFAALAAFVLGSALLHERTRCAAAYPLTLVDVAKDSDSGWFTFVSHPQLGAAIAADAAGLDDKAREHFDAALDAAERGPIRLLRPVTLFWRGRSLVEKPEPADRERGRALLVTALDDLRALGMVPYARLAEAALARSS